LAVGEAGEARDDRLMFTPPSGSGLGSAGRADAKEVFVGAAPAREIATKHRIGELPDVVAIVVDLDGMIADQGFVGCPMGIRHGQQAGALPGRHRDPFDRMLIARAMLEQMLLVANERMFDTHGLRPLW
jgi:PIN domain nuclease of toxin-antitoxin system